VQTRRQFVRAAGTAGAGLIVAPQTLALAAGTSPLLPGGAFDQGVLSGDPTPSSIVLWTHVGDTERSGAVRVEVATDKGFRKVVAHDTVRTSSQLGHSVKARVKGLKAGERYYYRFATAAKDSPVGRFQTAVPAGSSEPVRFAMISCQEYTLGYFNAHALLARENVDFVINTGDYIYGDVAWPTGIGVRKDPQQEARTVDQYRGKYALYRSDPNLQKVHANFAFIDIWDDHEVQNNYAGGAPDGGSEIGTPYSVARRNAAYKAWFEVMPTYSYGGRTRMYHKAAFGKSMDLFVLDERQYRSSQPCGKGPFPDCPDAGGDGTFLGAAQQAWFLQALKGSKANWKVVANELMIMFRRQADGQLPDTDSWQGYLRDREAVLAAAKAAGDVVFVTGDVHEFIAGEVHNAAGETVATEFVGTSITAASDNELSVITGHKEFGADLAHVQEPADHKAARLANNPEWKALDADHHGYLVCEVTPSEFKATWKPVATIRSKSTAALPAQTFTVKRGTPKLH
jgi:alkaline phosphatase D